MIRSFLVVLLAAGAGTAIWVGCAEPQERSAAVPVAFTMKSVSTANATLSSPADGRVQFRVEHELIRGITPDMLM